ncbi:hypothetical protein HKX48_003562 [Thoreauomyces humboldtii]|nr:hypothetical protein HKX48_003562 [Thoreauomyces humboldtii]
MPAANVAAARSVPTAPAQTTARSEHPNTQGVDIRTCDKQLIATVNRDFAIAARMEGTVILNDGRMINLGDDNCMKTCNTAGTQSGDFDCFTFIADTAHYPYGFGTPVNGQPSNQLIPYISIDDVGWSFKEHHCDFFAFRIGNYMFMEGERPLEYITTPSTTANCQILTYGFTTSPPVGSSTSARMQLSGTNTCINHGEAGIPIVLSPCSTAATSTQDILLNLNQNNMDSITFMDIP